MKYILSLLILITTSSIAQITPISSSEGVAQFQKVIQLDSGSLNYLYKTTNRWVALTFNSPKDVIMATLPNEEVRGQGYAAEALQLSGVLKGDLQYMFRIEIKPSKVRITIYSMVCIFPPRSYTIEKYVLKGDGTFRTNGQASDIIDGSTRVANNLIKSLEEALHTGAKKKDDW